MTEGSEGRPRENGLTEKDRRKFQLESTAATLSIPIQHLEGEGFAQIKHYVGVVLDTENLRKDMRRVDRALTHLRGFEDTRIAYSRVQDVLDIKHHILYEGFNGQFLNLERLILSLNTVADPYGWEVQQEEDFYSTGHATADWQARVPQRVVPNLDRKPIGWWEGAPRLGERVNASEHMGRVSEKATKLVLIRDQYMTAVLTHVVDLERLAAQEQTGQDLDEVPGLFPPADERFVRMSPITRLAANMLEDSLRPPEDRLVDRIEVAKALSNITKPYGLKIVDSTHYPTKSTLGV